MKVYKGRIMSAYIRYDLDDEVMRTIYVNEYLRGKYNDMTLDDDIKI